ncbi:hypothetical protein H0H81_004870 [Sphagnurus paluster]|uniref:Uncharacterized protein n=1 Tax=Sphagnurus paluster TaxID=117069 RepID=A0A9P7FSK7_9AGAR|nr:hypothetical protein H0H81_004870 [Sphagnurus paluster]
MDTDRSPTLTVEIIRVSTFFGKKVIAKGVDIPVPSAEGDIAYNLKSSLKSTKLWIHWKFTESTSLNIVTEPEAVSSDAANTETLSVSHLNDLAKNTQPEDSSENSLTKVMGYVNIFVDIGSNIADVHPIAKAAFIILTAGQKILQGQLDQSSKVKELWKTIATTLDFMGEAEPLAKIRGLEKHTIIAEAT